MDVVTRAKGVVKDRLGRVLLGPLNELIDENLTDVVTTVGSFVIKSIRGRFQREITFKIGVTYSDQWLEESLYGILYKYNDVKKSSRLELANSDQDTTDIYYRLADGTHTLKYMDYNIILIIQTKSISYPSGRINVERTYTIITYNLDPAFVVNFERDMILHRNSLLKLRPDSPTVNVYHDLHEGSDGYTYWMKGLPINKRSMSTIYLPKEIKTKLIDTVNNFFASKEYYKKIGRTHNLKIVLHGPPASGKESIAKTLASEWGRNIYVIRGGKGGRFIPHALESNSNDVTYPLFIISDIDKYPFLISDTDIELEKEEIGKEDKIGYRQTFGHMLNALDGITSGEDRITIMTTNYIEKFSPVFLRPGRIDLVLEIPLVGMEVFKKFTYDYYDGKILPDSMKLKSDKLTVADLQFDVIFLKLTVDEFVKKHCK